MTAAQIEYAKSNGFEEIILDANKIAGRDTNEENLTENVIHLLQQRKDVVVHTGKKNSENLSSEVLGKVLGTIAKEAVEKANVKRIVVAGGDTSSYAARAMEIEALEMMAPLVAGAPLCKAYSGNKNVEGIEINFKGGQVGGEDYFMILKKGRSISIEKTEK